MKNFISQAISQFGEIWKKIGVNQKISIVLVGVLIVGGLWAFVSIASRPNYEVMFSNISPEEGAKIASHLSDSGVPYKIKGNSILVPAIRKSEIRLSLANAKLLPSSGHASWSDFFAGGKIGTTENEMNINKIRAIQGELERTIECIASMRSARVHIVVPDDQLFNDNEKPATASVVIGLEPGAVLMTGQKNAIRYLVSNSVEGLTPSNISIIDTEGNVIAAGTGDNADIHAEGQLAYKRQVETDLARKAEQMLDGALGAGKSIVQVSVDINFDEVADVIITKTAGATLTEETTTSEDKNDSMRAGGEPGVAPNTYGVVSSSGGSDKISEGKSESMITKYDPSIKTVTTRKSPGNLERLSVAAFIDKEAEKGSLTESDFEEMIKNAVGYQEKRGDQILVREITFAAIPGPDTSSGGMRTSVIMGHILKNLPLAVVIVILLVFFKMMLKKTKLPEQEVPAEFRSSSRTASGAAMGGSAAGRGINAENMTVQEAEEELNLPEQTTPAMQKLMWKLADERPEELAQMLTAWLKD